MLRNRMVANSKGRWNPVPARVPSEPTPAHLSNSPGQAPPGGARALKLQGLVESFESRPSALSLSDLNNGLLAQARQGAGLEALSDEAYLLKRKLADRRGNQLVLRQAAERSRSPGRMEC